MVRTYQPVSPRLDDLPAFAGRQVRLRDLAREDLGQVVRWLNGRRYSELGQRLAPVNRKDLAQRFRVGNLSTWFIVEHQSGPAIGLAMYYQTPKTDSLSIDFLVAMPRYRRQGLEAEIITVLTDFIFRAYEVNLVYAEATEQDAYLRDLLRNVGFEEYRRAARSRDRDGQPVMIIFTRMRRARFVARRGASRAAGG